MSNDSVACKVSAVTEPMCREFVVCPPPMPFFSVCLLIHSPPSEVHARAQVHGEEGGMESGEEDVRASGKGEHGRAKKSERILDSTGWRKRGKAKADMENCKTKRLRGCAFRPHAT